MRTLILPLVLGVLMTSSSIFAQTAGSPAEQTLLQLVNQRRAEHGLGPVAWDAALARAARGHAVWMSREPGEEQHQYPGEPNLTTRAAQAGGRFSMVAENIATAQRGNVLEIERAWMNSPVHRGNILSPRVNQIGIAVLDVRGTLYAVEDFGHGNPVLAASDVESRAQQALRAQGIRLELSSEARETARANCVRPNGPIGRARLSLQWDGPDVNELPGVLMKNIPQVRGHAFAVGACPSTRRGEGFTTYHVAVLMY
jgi:hypothetical protein